MEGWIKIHRSIKKHWIWRNPNYLKAWITMIILVNHEDNKVLIQGELIDCKRGQSLNSLFTWVKEFGNGWTIQKVRTFFNLLKSDSMIDIEGMRKTTRLTICNYDNYQDREHTKNTQRTHKEHTKNNEITTNKNDKNDKNICESFEFYKSEATKAKKFTDEMSKSYVSLCRKLVEKDSNTGEYVLPFVLKIEKQISLDNYSVIYKKANNDMDKIYSMITSIQTNNDYHNKYINLYLTINKWLTK